MKRCISIVILICFSSFAIGQDLGLTEGEEKLYTRNKISISYKDKFVGLVHLSTGFITGENIRKWTPYLGFSKIPEAEFFQIAGYQLEASQASKYQQTAKTLVSVSLPICIVALVIAISPLLMLELQEDNDRDLAMVFGGGGLMLAAGIPLGIGASMKKTNWATLEQAIPIMEDYNNRLLQKIKEGK